MAAPANAEFVALGRGQSAGRIIYSVSDSAYLTKSGSAITEEAISGLSAADYGKNGLTADGNSRLILRYKSDKAGSVSFRILPGVPGARLESLTTRQAITSALPLASTSNGYQASAVFIAPETWPASMSYPRGDFTVTATFTPSDGGTGSAETLVVFLLAPPVVLIHGAYGSCEKMFGYATGTNKGVWPKLYNAGLTVAGWDYDSKKSPRTLIASNTNGLANIIADTLNARIAQGIESTRADLVTHSSGGLMARQYLRNDIDTGNKTANSYGLGTVRRVVTIASPNLGTPIASLLAKKFDTLPSSWQNWQAKSWWENTGYTLLKMLALKGAGEAMEDLALDSSYIAGLGYPGIPFHSVYGKVKSDEDKISKLFDDVVKSDIVALSQIDWLPKQLVDTLTSSKLALISVVLRGMSDDIRFKELLGALYGDDDHDLVVSETSAKDIFPSSAVTAFTGLGTHNHVMIAQQDDVGDRVLALLRGGADSFMVNTASASEYDAAFDSALDSFGEYLRASDEGDLSEYIDGSLSLEAGELVTEYLGADEDEPTTQSVKISGRSSAPFSDDVYVVLEDENGSAKFFRMDPTNTQSFDVDIWADSDNKGLYEVSYFTVQNGRLKISPAQTVAYPPMFTDSHRPEIRRPSTIYGHAGDEIPVGLVAVSENGNYDISAPALGVVSYEVSDTSVAEITDSGKVRALKEGSATITATAYGQTVSVDFVVKPAASEADTTRDLGDSSEAGGVGSGSSSGCSAGFGAVMMLAALAFVKSKR